MTEFHWYAGSPVTADDKAVYFDMDGTVADLYDVDGWLAMLESGNEVPYLTAKPMIDARTLWGFAGNLQNIGWKVGIVSWLAKNSSPEYDELVINAKVEWLHNNFPPLDEIVIIPYGTPKYDVVAPYEAILVDDEPANRMHWDASGPLRRSYPASELDELARVLQASHDDAAAREVPENEYGIVTAANLIEVLQTRLLLGIGDAQRTPGVELRTDGVDWFITFADDVGFAYYGGCNEHAIPLSDPEHVSQSEIDQAFAKADLLMYSLS